jgi:solute:Na+ symporter, SSS family
VDACLLAGDHFVCGVGYAAHPAPEDVFVNGLDYAVLLGTILGIAVYGVWRTRGHRDLNSYLKGDGKTKWFAIGLSVMATQASAVTFLSTPGQGYQDGLGFVQNYFGAPFALIIISAFFLPIYRRLNVYTAYEYLGRRFDSKTRLLGATLFLLQRGIGAGITIYAPAIVLSTVFSWRLDLTILLSGLVVIVYTVVGGSDAVTVTQKYQLGVVFTGMIAAFCFVIAKLPAWLSISDALRVAGAMHKLNAVDFSFSLRPRYTFFSGLIGGMFLALSYFGTDQSQVQRYIAGASLRESRLGLMFNAVLKIPMQFFILLLGAMLFVFFQFQRPPIVFNQSAWNHELAGNDRHRLAVLDDKFSEIHAEKDKAIRAWLSTRNTPAEARARQRMMAAGEAASRIQDQARRATSAKASEADYVFIDFILGYLPHGLVGLLVACFFSAALSSKAAELNALASTTTVDVYRHLIRYDATDRHYVLASKCFTVLWGFVALGFALFAGLQENLIQAANIVGSVFYGVPLALFLVAFLLPSIDGTATFWSAIVCQILVIILYFTLNISYLWYNLIGCAACVIVATVFSAVSRVLNPRASLPGAT